jgi:hypothetical protein
LQIGSRLISSLCLHLSNLAGFYEQRLGRFDTVHPVLEFGRVSLIELDESLPFSTHEQHSLVPRPSSK